jgi:hypothetical protein
MDWWAELYAKFGVPFPVLSYIVAVILGGGLFGGAWWLTGQAYARQQLQIARPDGDNLRPQLEEAKVKLGQFEERLRQAELAKDEQHAATERERTEKERALQQLDDRAKRASIRDGLGKLMLRGRELQVRCADESQPPPDADADAWDHDAEKYLRAELGDAYVARFRSSAGLPLGATSIQSLPHRQLWGGIVIRLARLDQFIQELSR